MDVALRAPALISSAVEPQFVQNDRCRPRGRWPTLVSNFMNRGADRPAGIVLAKHRGRIGRPRSPHNDKVCAQPTTRAKSVEPCWLRQ